MDDRHRMDAGLAGEELALLHLRGAGLELLIRNFRCRSGEIDLVMHDGRTLVLVEVRYRATGSFGGAAASVTWRKQRRIVSAARYLLTCRAELRRLPVRFDVVAITGQGDARSIEWIRGAFST